MPKRLAVFFLLLSLTGVIWAKDKPVPTNPDKGEILLAGLVLAPGRGGAVQGLPGGLMVLPGALVSIEGTQLSTTTDSRGLFIFVECPEGEVTVVITHSGYQPVRRKIRVEKGMSEAPTLRIEMLPIGTNDTSGVLSGSGTLYACFVPRTETAAGSDGDFMNLLAVLAAGVDPLTVGDYRQPESRDPYSMDSEPTSDATRSIMVRPPQAPARTAFSELSAIPNWPCFDKSGRVLYVSTIYPHRIDVLDVTKGNEALAWVPLEPNVFVTGLTLSNDGRLLYATQMGKDPGVLVVDTSTHLPVQTLRIDDSEGMIPNAAVCSPDGQRLYVVLSNGYNAGGAGRLVALDPATGRTLFGVEVGATPTDVLVTPDSSLVLTVNRGGGSVSVVDLATRQVSATLTVDVSPGKAALAPDGDRLLVVNRGSDTVSILSLKERRLLSRVKVGRGPMDIVLDKDGTTAYVSNYQDGTISVLDLLSGVVKETTPPMPRSNPIGLAVRP